MFKQIIMLLFMGFSLSNGLAQKLQSPKEQYNLEKGIALEGIDPISYFLQAKPEKGKKEFAVSDQGVLYFFSNQKNKDLFLSNPSKYKPEYGGWCAYAMGAKGEKVTVDPYTYKLVNNKLYLFYNQFFNNTLKDWNKDQDNLMRKADLNWKKLTL
jgi:YHS domain-containing protein